MKWITTRLMIKTSAITVINAKDMPTIKRGQSGLDIWHLPHESELARLVGQAIHLIGYLAKKRGDGVAIIA